MKILTRMLLTLPFILMACSNGASDAEAQSTKLVPLDDWIDQGRYIEVNGYNVFLVTAGKAQTEDLGNSRRRRPSPAAS